MIRLAKRANHGSINSDYVSVKDLAPAILELAGLVAAWEQYVEKYKVTLPNQHVGYGPDKVWWAD